MPSLTVLCGLCVVDVRLRLLLVLVLGRRVCRVIGLEGQVLLVGGACKNMNMGAFHDACFLALFWPTLLLATFLKAQKGPKKPEKLMSSNTFLGQASFGPLHYETTSET